MCRKHKYKIEPNPADGIGGKLQLQPTIPIIKRIKLSTETENFIKVFLVKNSINEFSQTHFRST